MQDRIVARLVTPTLVAVQLGALVTTLLWAFHGWVAGAPALLLSTFVVWRALQTGFVLDAEGLQVRPFLPFRVPPPIPWTRLRSVDVDEVVVGTETRSKKIRVRFLVEGQRAPDPVFGCRDATVDAVLERFRARGLAVTDQRERS